MVREVLIVRPSACEARKRKQADARTVAQRIGAYLIATQRLPDGIVAKLVVVRAEQGTAVALVTYTTVELARGDRFRGSDSVSWVTSR